ncbi:Splicing factor arginine:serine rich [Fasciola hepatica]|uniref:Splicing factor arginine:serine rich n=1 Tax=Fasciola hepatica TaxID=6192 RepID=A0A4E0QY45_FASHE|nr:Splicing factor arginine:serine rich [Fasciola hepatica]
MAVSVRSRIVQVTNISPSATTEQLRTLFGHVGVLEEFVMYPPDDKEEPASKVIHGCVSYTWKQVAFVRYLEPINAEVALHLNNTVFLDRALIVLPLANGLDSIPDEKYADLVRAPPHTAAGVLPRTADWPLDVISMVVGRPGEQVIQTIEPRLSSLAFPLYPPLPATTDGSRIEEIRRTILVTNLDPKTTGDQVLEFFNNNAEVRCVRMAGTEADRAAYVEFTQQPSIVKAFGLMGIMVQHSNCAIIKPANNFALYDDTAKLAGSNGAKAVERHKYRDRSRSRSRSHDRSSRSRHRSTSRRRRSRSRDRRRSRSRRSHGKRRSRTRSRSRDKKYRSRSISRDRRRGDRVRSRSRNRKKYHRSRSRSIRRRSPRSRSRGRKGDRRDVDRERASRSVRDKKSEKDRRDRDRDRDREKDRHRERERDRGKDSKSRRRREESSKPSGDANESTLSERRNEDDAQAAAVIAAQSTPHAPSEGGLSASKRSRRASSGSSYGSGSGSENGSDGDRGAQKGSPRRQNGRSEESNSRSRTETTEPKPNVVGVKLAGPEDMDHQSPVVSAPLKEQSLASPDSDSSGDAMDTEA